MRDLAIEAWSVFERFQYSELLVKPSLPILYFGDYDKFVKSELKIVTVGLNPSRREFPEDSPYSRFPAASSSPPGQVDIEAYLRSLNQYFYKRPYSAWFDFYEESLSGFNCSYYGEKRNTALHTDLLSPLATDPTWNGLSQEDKESLSAQGIPLWHKLIEFLLPDFILVSIRKSYLHEIRFERVDDLEEVFSIPRKNPYAVSVQHLQINPRKRASLVFGKTAQKPFGTINHAEKNRIGKEVLLFLREKGENI